MCIFKICFTLNCICLPGTRFVGLELEIDVIFFYLTDDITLICSRFESILN